MPKPLTLPAAALRLGWQHAVGDAARDKAAQSAVACLMLPVAGERYRTAPPLFRVRIGKRSAVFEVRAHGSQRCTGGRWERLDSDARPKGAAALAKLLRWWHGVAQEHVATRDAFTFADAVSRDRNRCATAPVIPNAPTPRPSGGSRGGKGPGGRASHVATFGHAPASGPACATHADPAADALAALRLAAANGDAQRYASALARLTRALPECK